MLHRTSTLQATPSLILTFIAKLTFVNSSTALTLTLKCFKGFTYMTFVFVFKNTPFVYKMLEGHAWSLFSSGHIYREFYPVIL